MTESRVGVEEQTPPMPRYGHTPSNGSAIVAARGVYAHAPTASQRPSRKWFGPATTQFLLQTIDKLLDGHAGLPQNSAQRALIYFPVHGQDANAGLPTHDQVATALPLPLEP